MEGQRAPEPSCTSLDSMGAASEYLELLRRSLVGSTTLFSEVRLNDSFAHRNARDSGLLSNSGYMRMRNLQCLLQDLDERHVRGELVEAGIWRGGVVVFMAGYARTFNASISRRVWGFDSFIGLPDKASGVRDPARDRGWVQGRKSDFAVTQERVRRHVDGFGLGAGVELVEGWFKDSMPRQRRALKRRGGIALLRIDGDLHSSTTQALELLYPLLNIGGWVVIDDWILTGARQAALEFRARHRITSPISYHGGWLVYPVARWRKEEYSRYMYRGGRARGPRAGGGEEDALGAMSRFGALENN